ncbi:alpha/beta fold hydrolase [Motiliproteus sediminis]|uniref:alpha/beta fold hydrolase n=1 Tax=Motiliproteus sediminis TaxID=1468178 RepID=UPI001AEF805F|nr:alpha/beta hydrolase [Motiliproteus sediminis]
MRSHYYCHAGRIETSGQRVAYRLYENHYESGERCLMLLHGAGVAAVDTWEGMLPFLQGWRWVLLPDLRGMGDTVELDGNERRFSVEEVAEDMLELLDALGWSRLDLGGYSFGGLVSLLMKQAQPYRFEKQYLLESALLDRASQAEVVRLRERYSEAAALLRESAAEEGIRMFLDAIAPNRIKSPRSEAITIERLGLRPQGFSYALDAVTDASQRLDRAALIDAQGDVSSFVGGRSVELMHDFQRQLAAHQSAWFYHPVSGCDHSLPYQKPRQIGRLISEELRRYLA